MSNGQSSRRWGTRSKGVKRRRGQASGSSRKTANGERKRKEVRATRSVLGRG
jgi:hypothetical protein